MKAFSHLRHPDRLFAVLIIAVAAVMYSIAGTLSPADMPGVISASTYPKLILGCIILTSCLVIILPAGERTAEQSLSLRGVQVITLTAIYIVSIEPAGFFIVTPLFLYLLPLLLGFRRHLINLISAVVNTALVYLVFVTTLSIPLPPGLLGD